MRGYLLTRKNTLTTDSVLGPLGAKGLAVAISFAVIGGCLAAMLRLHLGLPGHKAILWMTPVIAGRLLGRCRIGATAGSFTAAFVSLGLGGNIAGNLMGLPLVGAAGALVDAAVFQLEKRKPSPIKTIIAVAVAAMLANLLCCAKRLLSPPGIGPGDVLTGFSILLRPMSYAFFGLLAGLIAAATAYLAQRRKNLNR